MKKNMLWVVLGIGIYAGAIGCRAPRVGEPSAACVVDAQLLDKPDLRPTGVYCPYGGWLVECLYKVVRVHSGLVTNKEIVVVHAAISNWQIAPSYAERKIGNTYRLQVARASHNNRDWDRVSILPRLSPPDDVAKRYWYLFVTEQTPPLFFDVGETTAAYTRFNFFEGNRSSDPKIPRLGWGIASGE